jgi:methionyl-tRNA formyltransferase
MKILLLAEEAAGIHLLRMLVASPHQVVAVMTSPPLPLSSQMSGLSKAAESQGHPVWPARMVKAREFPERIRAEQVDLLLNIHSLVVLPPPVLEAPRYGCFNLHPAPLPRYAGLDSVSWAIYRGEIRHGVTLHWMAPEIDAGPIAYQSLFDIAADATALSVFTRCVKEGLTLFSKLLQTAAIDPREIPQLPQDLSQREYLSRKAPNGARLSWSWPARDIVNFVRACDFLPFRSPWGHPQQTTLDDGQDLSILKSARTGQLRACEPGTVGEATASGVLVAGFDEWIAVSHVLVAGRACKATDVLLTGSRLLDTPIKEMSRAQYA